MASLIPGYEYDIFISYRQKDNKYDGWVTEFVDNLKRELEATFKEDVSVYFDINPHDGLLETHDVNASLKEKLKCLVFLPIISQTYCDPKSFAWEHELKAFIEQASNDEFGLKVKLAGGNVANRILPVQIHDLDAADKALLENELGGVLRAIEFIYKEAGVNRPLRSNEENPAKNLNQTIYRNQVNKAANSIRDIINGIRYPSKTSTHKLHAKAIQQKENRSSKRNLLLVPVFILLLSLAGYFLFAKWLSPRSSDKSIEKSIAVLPFTDMSQKGDQEYLGDGIAQEILESLSKFNDLVVIARISSFSFKGKNEDIREIGDKLKVSYILTGSVRKEENQVRVIVELINASTGRTIYSEPYNYESKKILSLESDIAVEVAEKIISRISSNEKLQFANKNDVNPEAYEAYLKGRKILNTDFSPSKNENAKKLFKAAVSIDPGFSEGYGFLSIAYTNLSSWAYPLKEKKIMLDSAALCAKKSMVLDENNSIAHLAMGGVYEFKYDLINASNEINKAYALNPGGSLEKTRKALYHILLDKEDDAAISLAKDAARLDPLNPGAILGYANVLLYAERYDECISTANHLLVVDSSLIEDAREEIAWAYEGKKEYKTALQFWSKNHQLRGNQPLAELYLKLDFKPALSAYLMYFSKLPEKTRYSRDFLTSYVYAFMKDGVNTLKYLDQAYQNDEIFIDLKRWKGFDFIRNDPAFIDLYEKVGFKAYDEYKKSQK